MTRRSLLTMPALPKLSAASARVRPACQTNAWRIQPGDFATFLSVLDRIKSYGYSGFETGFRNVETRFAQPALARGELAKRKLVFLGCHIFLLQYDSATSLAAPDLVERVITGAASLGAERVILSGASIPNNRPAQKRKAEALNRYGALCRKAGMQGIAYHNHDREFLEGGAEIEALLQDTEPAHVRLILDAGHAYLAQANIDDFLKRHSPRIDGIHLRDFQGREQVPLGQGAFPLQTLAETLQARQWSGWIINEEERLNDVKPGDAAVAPARAQIRKFFGV